MRVLITGAAGTVGRVVAAALPDCALMLTDIKPLDEPGWQHLDVTDRDTVREAVAQCDTILHLAIRPQPGAFTTPREWPYDLEKLRVETVGTYNVLRHAAELGKRAVYASSFIAFEGYPHEQLVTEETLPQSHGAYGLGKVCGEAWFRELHEAFGLRGAIVRMGGWMPLTNLDFFARCPGMFEPRDLSVMEPDVARGFRQAVLAEKPFGVLHLMGEAPGLHMDLSCSWRFARFWPEWESTDCGFQRHEDFAVPPEKDCVLVDAASLGDEAEVERLLKTGAEARAANSVALRFAGRAGDTQTVARLLRGGAEVNANQGSPLRAAASSGDLPTVELLLASGADPGLCDGDVLSWAAAAGSEPVVRHLLGLGAATQDRKSCALARATMYGYTDIMRRLLEAGADPNFGGGEIMRRAVYGNSEPIKGYPEAVRVLCEAGVRIVPKWEDPSDGCTPLVEAVAFTGDPAIVQALLDGGADPAELERCHPNYLLEAVQDGHVEALRLCGFDAKGERLAT